MLSLIIPTHGYTLGIHGMPPRPDGARLMVATIQCAVADFYGIDETDMRSQRRGRAVAHPRQVAMYLAKQLTPKSLPDIGRRFGGRDHTTVMHAIQAVEGRIATDGEIAGDVAELRRRLAA